MKNVILAAAAKAIKDAAETLAVGEYGPGEAVLRVSWDSIRKGADESYIPTASIPVKDALILFAAYAGITRDAALSALERAMTDAVNGNKAADLLTDKDVEAVENRVLATLAALPAKVRTGKTTIKGAAVEVLAETA